MSRSPTGSLSEKDNNGFCSPIKQVTSVNNEDSTEVIIRKSDGCRGRESELCLYSEVKGNDNSVYILCLSVWFKWTLISGTTSSVRSLEDNPLDDYMAEGALPQVILQTICALHIATIGTGHNDRGCNPTLVIQIVKSIDKLHEMIYYCHS